MMENNRSFHAPNRTRPVRHRRTPRPQAPAQSGLRAALTVSFKMRFDQPIDPVLLASGHTRPLEVQIEVAERTIINWYGDDRPYGIDKALANLSARLDIADTTHLTRSLSTDCTQDAAPTQDGLPRHAEADAPLDPYRHMRADVQADLVGFLKALIIPQSDPEK